MSAQRRSSSGTPSKSNWYPTKDQLSSPDSLMGALKQVLDQHYALQQQVNTMVVGGAPLHGANRDAGVSPSGPPPGSGPTDTQILGLRVAPVNPSTLANGAKLTWVAKDGNFQFL